MTISRRTVLGTAGAAGVAALAGAAARPAAGSARSARVSSAVPDWAALDASLDGSVERPGTAGYDAARRLYDPRFDGVRPPAVARCAHSADVAEAVRFARRSGVPIVPRGGGHSYVGASTSTSALVLAVRRLSAVG
ncbi:FAD-binding protein, partial [Actinoplanes sp. NPDC051633]|uniref:FAD-binding oxidoreductase n=1 Tax=Actinoplanes sp. NPDC051633 TaxID=3155670 RepID=UPI003435A063